MTFQICLIHYIKAVFITELIPAWRIGIMRTANRIDIASLHQLNILAHALFGDGIAGDRVELVSVYASQLDRCPVDSEYAFSIDLIMAEAEGHGGFLQLFFSKKS